MFNQAALSVCRYPMARSTVCWTCCGVAGGTEAGSSARADAKGKVPEETPRTRMCEPWIDPFRQTFFDGDEPCQSYTATAQGATTRSGALSLARTGPSGHAGLFFKCYPAISVVENQSVSIKNSSPECAHHVWIDECACLSVTKKVGTFENA